MRGCGGAGTAALQRFISALSLLRCNVQLCCYWGRDGFLSSSCSGNPLRRSSCVGQAITAPPSCVDALLPWPAGLCSMAAGLQAKVPLVRCLRPAGWVAAWL
jgi:hypothetical protein